ncbi:MAG: hydroxyquinol 1,2-dioxygenase [Hyphomicrobiales bacterium]|jgi:hydroxyquinol 1,2-dioxygenase|nr:hydroxyquinol 1,2-dioxygenase [Hyphomicrobiales bacterium]
MALETGADFTKSVLKRWEDIPDPRLREVMQSAIKHLHGFVSDVKPTGAEWFKAIQFLTAIGHKCDDKRQEFILASDVMGVSMLIDDINNRRIEGATPSTVEGPFHIPDAPEVAHGADMAKGAPGIPCFVSGTVRGLSGEPVGGAILDLWQTDGEGLYEEQRRTAEPWMRGIYRSKPDGSYSIRTVAPISYSIPMDGPIGEFFGRTTMSHIRPAHIHFAISAPGYHGVVTHLFQKGDKFIDNDVVYGVKAPLVVAFVKRPPGKAPNGDTVDTEFYEVKYDFVLEEKQAALAAAE